MRTLAYKVEQWGIDMLRLHADLPPELPIVHADADPKNKATRIILTGKTSERSLEGCQPYAVGLRVELFSSLRDVETVETYTKAIEETFSLFPEVASTLAFSYLELLPEGEDEKDTEPEERQRGRTYNFLALEAA